MYDYQKSHDRYIHKRNSQYWKYIYTITIAQIIEDMGVDHATARKIYFDRVNKIREYSQVG
jgi:hypothetical protein